MSNKTLVIAEKPSVAQDIVRALTPVAGMEEHRAAFVATGVLSVVCVIGAAIERQKGPLKELLLTWFEGRRQPVLRPR